MLRKLLLKNFVGFKNSETVEFGSGLHLLVGENTSGKTSLFEAIRRTSPLRINTTMSKIPDRDKISYVVAKYEVTDTEANQSMKSPQVGKVDKVGTRDLEQGIYYSFMLYNPTENGNGNYYKAVVVSKKSKPEYELHASQVQNDKEKPKYIEHFTFSEEDAKNAYDSIDAGKTAHDGMTEVFKIITKEDRQEKMTTRAALRYAERTIGQCEIILEKLKTKMVFLFPLRGLGPLDWCYSDKFEEEETGHIEKQEKDEIIKWFLQRDNTEDEKDREEMIFKKLTNNANIVFRLDGNGNVFASEKMSSDEPKKIHSILAVSEGVLMAKQISIILSIDGVTTMYLEEPARGMHPQMVLRLRDLVLFPINQAMDEPNAREKLILISTHNRAMISPWTAPRVLFCKKSMDRTRILSNIFTGTSDDLSSLRTRRILTNDHFSTLFFARNVLYVEGDSDYVFVTALKMKILEAADDGLGKRKSQGKDCDVRRIVQMVTDTKMASTSQMTPSASTEKDKDVQRLVEYITTLHILKMDGETHRKRLDALSRNLELDYYFLLDKDGVLDKERKKPSTLLKKLGDHRSSKKMWEKSILNKDDVEVTDDNWLNIRRQIQIHFGIFVWTCGNLEDMLTAFIQQFEDSASGPPEKKRKFVEELDKRTRPASCAPTTSGKKASGTSSQQDAKEESTQSVFDYLEKHNVDLLKLKTKKKRRSRDKIFNNDQITDEEVSKCMGKFLAVCKKPDDDIAQFFKFLLNCEREFSQNVSDGEQ